MTGRIPNDRINQRIPIRMRDGTFQEVKYLPQGAYVRAIDPYYLPRDFSVSFCPITEVVVYSQFGMGVVPKCAVEKERW